MGTLIRFLVFICFFTVNNNLLADLVNGNSVTLQVLDKFTARINDLEIIVGKEEFYGSLTIEILDCKKRPPEEIPEDFVLLRIFDKISENNNIKIFQGWMLSSSPAIAPLEHPTYDVWVKSCNIEIDSE